MDVRNLKHYEKLSLIGRCFHPTSVGSICTGFTANVPLRDSRFLPEPFWVDYIFTALSPNVYTVARQAHDGTEVPIGVLSALPGEYGAEKFIIAQCSDKGTEYVDWGAIEKFM